MHRRILFALLPALLFCVPAPAQGETVLDYWAVMQTKGHDLGYVHTHTARIERDGQELYESTGKMRMSMNRLGSEITVSVDTVALEKPDGKPVFMSFAMKQSSQEAEVEIHFADGQARIVTELMGRPRERTIPYPSQTVGPWGLHQAGLRHGFAPGSSYEATTFSVDQQKVTDVYTEIIGPEKIVLLDGTEVELTKATTEQDVVPVPTTVWIDHRGIPLKSFTNIAGLALESHVTSKERALAALESKEQAPDVFTDTMIVSEQFLPFPRDLDSAVLVVSPREGAKVEILSDTKQVASEPNGSRQIRVAMRRHVPPANHKGVRPLRDVPAELEAALTPSTMIQSDEAEIIEIAERVVGNETDAWKAAQTLEDWVQRNLTEKGFDVGFASALEVCRDRRGDCSEHAVFLAALCRASGIPCRVSMGVLYIGGIWGGHAWNEVWIDGDWYALDATLGFGSVDPLHLSFASMNMQDGDDGFTPLLKNMGKVDIRVTEVTLGGRTLAVDDSAVEIEGDRYTNHLWAFGCSKPDDFEFDVAQPRAAISFEVLEIEGSGGDNRKIEISILDLPADFAWDSTLVNALRGGSDEISETVVDGRSGRLVAQPHGKDDRCFAMIPTRSALFLFVYHGPQDEENLELFRRFLGTIDFDVHSN